MVVTVLLAILSTILILVGLVGVIIPILPGVPIAWVGLFIFAIGTGFHRISVITTVVFFVLMLLTFALDYAAPLISARKYKASKWGILGAWIGTLLGIFIFGLWGIILGPFLGAILGELISGRQSGQALKSAIGTLIGMILGNLLKIILVLVLLGFLVASWF